MFDSLLDFAKNMLVSTSILKPIYSNVRVPFYQNVCKPIIEMAIECTWWIFCSVDVKNVGKQCKGTQTIEELCDITGHELNMSQQGIGALAIGAGVLTLTAGSYFLYSRNRSQQKMQNAQMSSEFNNTRALINR